jgi:hypothetical protein
MKAHTLRKLLVVAALAMASIQVRSQTYTILHDFAPEGVDPATSEVTNADGDLPRTHLTVSGSTIYGVTSGGCSNGIGGVFRLNTDGNNFTNLFNFSFPMLVISRALVVA